MKQYMLSVHHDETFDPSTIAPETMQEMFTAVEAFNQKLQDEGAWIFAGGLEAPDVATTIRPRDGELIVTDGPYSETKDFLGGFWVIRAEDLDAALDWAKQGATACQGAVQVRPFQEEPED